MTDGGELMILQAALNTGWRLAGGLALFLALTVLCSLPLWKRGSRTTRRRLCRLSNHNLRVLLLPAFLSLLLSALLSFRTRPHPRIHDEFSHLLLADTLAHGRLANPPHPMRRHFETMHVLQEPAYASKYPPGPGAVMAFGQVLTGRPIVGSWLAGALAVMAVTWMLLAWFPARWALVGGLLCATHTVSLYWSQTYLSGGVALAGGALVAGGLLHALGRKPCRAHGAAVGTGLVLLSASRPGEGLVFAVILAVWALIECARHRRWSALLRSVVLPACPVLALAAAMLLYYNHRVTGSALKMPYMLHAERYSCAPNYVFQKQRPIPGYRHEQLRKLHAVFELQEHRKHRESPRSYLRMVKCKAQWLAGEVCRPPPLVLATLIACLLALRADRRTRMALATTGAFIGLLLLAQVWINTYYVAPTGGLLVALVVSGARRLRLWQRHRRRLGLALFQAAVLVHLIGVAQWFRAAPERQQSFTGWNVKRAGVLQSLREEPGQDLVLVRYPERHDVHEEWVFNAADIDAAPVVWARDLGPGRNRELLEYFHNRKVWQLRFDGEKRWVAPYPLPRSERLNTVPATPGLSGKPDRAAPE